MLALAEEASGGSGSDTSGSGGGAGAGSAAAAPAAPSATATAAAAAVQSRLAAEVLRKLRLATQAEDKDDRDIVCAEVFADVTGELNAAAKGRQRLGVGGGTCLERAACSLGRHKRQQCCSVLRSCTPAPHRQACLPALDPHTCAPHHPHVPLITHICPSACLRADSTGALYRRWYEALAPHFCRSWEASEALLALCRQVGSCAWHRGAAVGSLHSMPGLHAPPPHAAAGMHARVAPVLCQVPPCTGCCRLHGCFSLGRTACLSLTHRHRFPFPSHAACSCGASPLRPQPLRCCCTSGCWCTRRREGRTSG